MVIIVLLQIERNENKLKEKLLQVINDRKEILTKYHTFMKFELDKMLSNQQNQLVSIKL